MKAQGVLRNGLILLAVAAASVEEVYAEAGITNTIACTHTVGTNGAFNALKPDHCERRPSQHALVVESALMKDQ